MLFSRKKHRQESAPSYALGSFIPRVVRIESDNQEIRTTVRSTSAVAVFALLALQFSDAGMLRLLKPSAMSAAAPVILIEQKEPYQHVEMTYGSTDALTQATFYENTKKAFIEAEQSFVAVDLLEMQLHYFDHGQDVFTARILNPGTAGTWWEVPAGLYKVTRARSSFYSEALHIYQPWTVFFQENYFIHGWPEYVDGTPVEPTHVDGGIRLSTEDAEQFYHLIEPSTPVIVHTEESTADTFAFSPKVAALGNMPYVALDMLSDTTLASNNIKAQVPIASLTKLMTAVVAAEYIDLATDVHVSQEEYVTTLVPRLEGRTTVSMYSLLQLLLVESSNEAAEVIAAQVGRAEFIERMNQKAATLGLADTVFTDPSGLDDGNVSTVADLTRLAQYIYNNRNFIFTLSMNAELPAVYTTGEFGELENFNQVDGIDTMIGGKVGETLAAGQTSLTLHTLQFDGVERVVALIILGSQSREQDVTTLHEFVTKSFSR